MIYILLFLFIHHIIKFINLLNTYIYDYMSQYNATYKLNTISSVYNFSYENILLLLLYILVYIFIHHDIIFFIIVFKLYQIYNIYHNNQYNNIIIFDITNYVLILIILLMSITPPIIELPYILISFYYVNIINVFASCSIIFIDFVKI